MNRKKNLKDFAAAVRSFADGEKRCLSLEMAADCLCVSDSILIKYQQSGDIEHYMLDDGLIVFDRKDLDNWMQKKKQGVRKKFDTAYRDML